MKKVGFIMAFTLLLIMGMSFSALAKDKAQMTPPQIITLAAISLPLEMKEKYAEQTVPVKIKATVSELGTVDGDVQIITSSGDAAFDNAVIESIKKSMFSPAYSDNTAVSCSIVLPLHVKVEKNIPEEQVGNETPPISDNQ
ncbi:TonB family protein [Pelosinus baikalensis]|uniref:Energy transducer TonB n=1 Tax=Pelosinus baikalensis TaxID=2892015 RepID=A0ABS8I0U2_9FIRM|nr:energy transducer TonB [Pelosinus baikalensis]